MTTDLTRGSPLKRIFFFAIPFLLGNLFQQFYNVVDMVIVGRSADVLLQSYKPFNIFVYADMESKIKRCRWRAPVNEQLTDRELARKIKQVDAGRKRQRKIITDSPWGKKESYHLCINTTGRNIKDLVSPVAEFAKSYFR